MQLKTDEKDDAANTLIEAYKSFRRTDPKDAARVLQEAISLFTAKGNFRRAAGYQFNLAELYEIETEIFNSKDALNAYDLAAEWYASDQADAYVICNKCSNHDSLANKSWLKVADLAALAGEYSRAIDRYESVARASLNSNLTKWSVKDYFFKAGACYLANKVYYFTALFISVFIYLN
jgi:alpha-soluble NSF attachment protein